MLLEIHSRFCECQIKIPFPPKHGRANLDMRIISKLDSTLTRLSSIAVSIMQVMQSL